MGSPYNGFSWDERLRVGKVQYALMVAGKMPRPTKCRTCNALGSKSLRIYAHLEDYSTPTEYFAMCARCHLILHRRFWAPTEFEEYTSELPAEGQALMRLLGSGAFDPRRQNCLKAGERFQ